MTRALETSRTGIRRTGCLATSGCAGSAGAAGRRRAVDGRRAPLPALGTVDRTAAAMGVGARGRGVVERTRSEEHTSELQSLMRISYAVFCLEKKTTHIRVT